MASRYLTRLFKHGSRNNLQQLQRQARRCQSALSPFEESLYNFPDTEVSTLDNGFRVASEDSGFETCTVGVYIDGGSRFETETNNGVAHFLEHIAFKGSKQRTQKQLEIQVENMGAQLNAYTSRELTVYYAKCFKTDLPKAVNILSDLIQHPLLSRQAIENERGVILREAEEVATQMEEVIFDELHATAYQNTPLGMTILGPEENIRTLQQEDLRQYIDTHYTAPRIVLAAAGDVDHTQLVDLAEQNFSKLKSTTKEGSYHPCPFTGSEYRRQEDNMPYAHVAMCVEGVGWTNPDYFTLMLASMMVGQWNKGGGFGRRSGDLMKTVSEQGLAQSYMCFNTCYTDTGLWGVYSICEPHTVEHMVSAVQDEWRRLCTSVTEEEVRRAKEVFKTNFLLQFDGSTPTCEDIGRQMITYGRRMPLPEWNHRVDAITVDTFRDVCAKYIFDKYPAVSAIGPVHGLPAYNDLCASHLI